MKTSTLYSLLKVFSYFLILSPVPVLHYYAAKSSGQKQIVYNQGIDPFLGTETPGENKPVQAAESQEHMPVAETNITDPGASSSYLKLFVELHDRDHHRVEASLRLLVGANKNTSYSIPANAVSTIENLNDNSNAELICNVMGYHSKALQIDLSNPMPAGSMVKKGDTLFLDIALDRCKKGEVIALDNISFHPNSNVLTKSSDRQLNKLLEMLKQNPDVNIKVCGYVYINDQKAERKAQEESVMNLFELEKAKNISGSAKKLALLRIKAIRRYLVKRGIKEKRLEVKAYGRRKSLQKKKISMPDQSFDIEIELLN